MNLPEVGVYGGKDGGQAPRAQQKAGGNVEYFMDDLVTLFSVPVLCGAVISMVLCAAHGDRKRPSFWLAPLSAVATGIAMFLCMFGGVPMFTRDFWDGFNTAMEPGLTLLFWSCGIFGFISLFPSLGVIAIYRRLRK